MFVDYNKSIMNYVASIRSYFGLKSSYKDDENFTKLINESKPKRIFLLLVDGMGANLINNKLAKDSFLRKNMTYQTTTVYPPTTTAATTAIRNGKSPNENAWLGWMQYLKEVDDVIIPFYGIGFYNNIDYDDCMNKYLPVTSTEEELNNNGHYATKVFPSFEVDGCEDFDTMCNRLVDYSYNSQYEYVYAYWDKYDTYMHEYGPSSKICDSYLLHINYEIERLANELNKDTMLVVVADHGQIDVEEEINLYPKYKKYFRIKPALEPRSMAFYIKSDMKDEFKRVFNEELGDRFKLLSKKEVIESKLFGTTKNNKRFEEFLGDFIALATDKSILAYKKSYKKAHKGAHAGTLKDELMIPVIVVSK